MTPADMEWAIEFLLNQQAATEAQLGRFGHRVDDLAGLVQTGMKLLVDFQAESREKINILIDAELRCDQRLAALSERMDQLAEA